MKSSLRILFGIAFLIGILGTSPAHAVCSNNEDGEAGVADEIEYFTPENVLRYCDGTNWVDMVESASASNLYAFVSDNLPDGDLVTEATSRGFGGSDGVLAGDFICQDEADAQGLPGTYFAWISGPDADDNAPADRFTQSARPYVMPVSLTKVADNWNDLTDGDLDNNIDIMADGNTVGGDTNVRTNVNSNGTTDGSNHCLDWTSSSSGEDARRGRHTSSDSNWTDSGTSDCSSSNYHIYCFQQNSATGLTGHWKFDETSGTTIADSSGNGNDGTLVDATGVVTYANPSPVNTALIAPQTAPDGSAVKTLIPDVFPAGTNLPFTVATWYNRPDKTRSLWGNGVPGVNVEMSVSDDNLQIVIPSESTFNNSIIGEPLNEWVHYVVTYDGTTITSYQNGSQVASAARNVVLTDDDFFIGGRQGSNGGGGAIRMTFASTTAPFPHPKSPLSQSVPVPEHMATISPTM